MVTISEYVRKRGTIWHIVTTHDLQEGRPPKENALCRRAYDWTERQPLIVQPKDNWAVCSPCWKTYMAERRRWELREKDQRRDEEFHKMHTDGAARWGDDWRRVNEQIVDAATLYEMRVENHMNRAILTLIAWRWCEEMETIMAEKKE